MKNQELIAKLYNCVAHCNYCATACLEEDNVNKMVSCIKTDQICAAICNTTAQLLSYGYENVDKMMQECQQICTQCAEECEKHEHDHCKKCAEACKTCAEACANYLS